MSWAPETTELGPHAEFENFSHTITYEVVDEIFEPSHKLTSETFYTMLEERKAPIQYKNVHKIYSSRLSHLQYRILLIYY